MNIENNDWILLNNIVYKINSIDNLDKMRKSFMEFIRTLIPYSKCAFFLSDPGKPGLLGYPIGIGCSIKELHEYVNYWQSVDYVSWIFQQAKSMVYRESDLLSDNIREKEAMYTGAYLPKKMHYSMGASFSLNDEFLGVVNLYRTKDGEDFSDRDMFLLGILKDHMELRLYHELQRVRDSQEIDKGFDLHYYAEYYKLTLKEMEIIHLFLQEYSDEDICEKLYISSSTFKKHISNIYRKLNIKNRIELLKTLK